MITLTEPDNDLAFNLGQRAGAVLNEGATGLENTANGTGPFTLGEWNQGSSITLVRNDDYWGEPATIAEVTFQYFTDPNAAANALLDGDTDLHVGVDTDLVEQFEGNPDYVITNGPTNGEFTLGINNADEALSDQRVRQAITQAIDKQGLIDLNSGYGTLIGAPVPPFEPWYEDLTGLYPYDPDAARALLEEAGYGDGLELTFVVPNIYPTVRPTTSCRSSPTSASPSTCRPSSSRRGSSRCTPTTTTTSPSCSTSSRATSTTTPTPSTTGCTTAPRCRSCSPQAKIDGRSRGVERAAPPGGRADRRGRSGGVAAACATTSSWPAPASPGYPTFDCQGPLRRLRHHRGGLTASRRRSSARTPAPGRIG